MRAIFLFIAIVTLCAGCASHNVVLVATGTNIGVSIGQNPTTGMYEAKLGYNRGELAMVPSTNHYTPDVITELKYKGIFSTGTDGGIYQRMAVGSVAVSQPGATAMFLKDGGGNISSNTAAALQSLSVIPKVNPVAQIGLVKIASAYRAAVDKTPWDALARQHGYQTFAAFLIDPTQTPEKVSTMAEALRVANLLQ